jgi:hypothetical protein
MSSAGALLELARRCRREAGHRPTHEAISALREMAAEYERRAAAIAPRMLSLPAPGQKALRDHRLPISLH